MLDISNRS